MAQKYGRSAAYDITARTFFCYSCQSEQPIVEKVRKNKSSTRCKSCMARAKARPQSNEQQGAGSWASMDIDHWRDCELPQNIMDAYRDATEE